MQFTNWTDLNKALNGLSVDELKSAINMEVSTSMRTSFITKLHQRYCKLRDASERGMLLKRETLL